LRDGDGDTVEQSFQVTVLNPALTITAGPSQSVGAGSTFSLIGATFRDPGAPSTYTATVDWGDDTPASTNAIVSEPATEADLGRVFDSHVYGQPGVYSVTVTVKEPNQPAVSDSFTVTVTNAVPAVNAGADILAGPGVPVHVNATFSDPGFPVGGVSESYTATINWGDNTTSPGTVTVTPGSSGVPTIGTVTGTHQYTGNGPYTVTVTVADGSASGRDTLLVADSPPTVDPGPDLTGNEGSPISLSATFSDQGFNYNGATKSFTATIDWGDGTSSTGGVTVLPGSVGNPTTGTVSGTHTYATFGTFPITIRVKDEAGAEGLGSLKADVSNLAPTVDPIPVGSFFPGSPFILHATFNDPGRADTHTVTIDWGDGSSVQTVDSNSFYAAEGGALLPMVVGLGATSAGRLTIGHLYSDDLAHTVTVIVTDNGGLSSSSALMTINHSPTAVLDSYMLLEDEPLQVPVLAGLLRNDSDVDGTALTAMLVENVRHGTLALAPDGSFTYQPAANFHGEDSFSYKANDGTVDGNTVTVSLKVASVPDLVAVSAGVRNGTYGIGAVIPIRITFDEAVVVETTGGIPTLKLNSGETARYVSGSGTNTLTFRYVVGVGRVSPRLDYTDDHALKLNGGTIHQARPTGGVINADLTLPAPGRVGSIAAGQAIRIDGMFPRVKRLEMVRYDPRVRVLTYQVVFSRPVIGLSPADFQILTTGTLKGARITSVTGGGATWAVQVQVGPGRGTIKLNLKDRNSIHDGVGNPLGGPAKGDGAFNACLPYFVTEGYGRRWWPW
ncbi:MAG: Ig-like domain-containing protein, partial [Gemmataceae bacterium]